MPWGVVKLCFSFTSELEIISVIVIGANSTPEIDTLDTFLQEARTYLTYKIVIFTDRYWFPVLMPLGLLGNTLSFLVMIKKSNRKISTCIYMAAISINDNLMLLCVLHVHSTCSWRYEYRKMVYIGM